MDSTLEQRQFYSMPVISYSGVTILFGYLGDVQVLCYHAKELTRHHSTFIIHLLEVATLGRDYLCSVFEKCSDICRQSALGLMDVSLPDLSALITKYRHYLKT